MNKRLGFAPNVPKFPYFRSRMTTLGAECSKGFSNFSKRTYLFIISDNFPLWLALIFLSAFCIDSTYTTYVVYSDKADFLLRESNALLKYSLSSGYWFLYALFAILSYSIMVIISKKYSNIALRSLFLILGLTQLGTPIAWKLFDIVFFIFYLCITGVVHLSLFYQLRGALHTKSEISPTLCATAHFFSTLCADRFFKVFRSHFQSSRGLERR